MATLHLRPQSSDGATGFSFARGQSARAWLSSIGRVRARVHSWSAPGRDRPLPASANGRRAEIRGHQGPDPARQSRDEEARYVGHRSYGGVRDRARHVVPGHQMSVRHRHRVVGDPIPHQRLRTGLPQRLLAGHERRPGHRPFLTRQAFALDTAVGTPPLPAAPEREGARMSWVVQHPRGRRRHPLGSSRE